MEDHESESGSPELNASFELTAGAMDWMLSDPERRAEHVARRLLQEDEAVTGDVALEIDSVAWLLDAKQWSFNDLTRLRELLVQRRDVVQEQLDLERLVQRPDKVGWVTGSHATGLIETHEAQLRQINAQIAAIDQRLNAPGGTTGQP